MKMGDRLRQAEANWSENSSPHLQRVIPGSCHAVIKKPPASAGDAGDMGSIPGSGRFPGGGNATHSSILAWRESHGQKSLVGDSPWGWKVGHD